jgi:hypothetical protein
MTLFDGVGLYVGWDRGGIPHRDLRIFCGSVQVQVGLLLLGCDWFFNQSRARDISSTTQPKDGRSYVASVSGSRVVSGQRL